MIKTIKDFFAIYRRYEIDIWGIYRMSLNPRSRVSKFFAKIREKKKKKLKAKYSRYVYRVDIREPEYLKRKMKRKFADPRIMRYFYLFYTFSEYKKMKKSALRKIGNFIPNFVWMLEGRFICGLFRMQFITNYFNIDEYLECNSLLLDGRRIINRNDRLDIHQVISPDSGDYEVQAFVQTQKSRGIDKMGFAEYCLYIDSLKSSKRKHSIKSDYQLFFPDFEKLPYLGLTKKFPNLKNIKLTKSFLKKIKSYIKSYINVQMHLNYKDGFVYSIRKPSTRMKLRAFIGWRLKKKLMFFSKPRYMYIDYSLMIGYVKRIPEERDLAFPTYLDLQRITELRY